MKISSKLIGISLGSVVIVSGLVVSLLLELKFVNQGYNDILQGPVQQAEAAQQTQHNLQQQVHAWKNILLRGDNPSDLAKYTNQFREQEAAVKAGALTLANTVKDPAARKLLNEFLTEDATLSGKYQAAYDVDVKEKFDFKAADKRVSGQDRPAAALLERISAQLNARIVTLAAAQQAAAIRQIMMVLIVVGGLLIVDSFVYCGVLLGVLRRLGRLKAVSDRLANADIEGLSVDISGNDEIGAIGESMKGVAAAIEELLVVHSH